MSWEKWSSFRRTLQGHNDQDFLKPLSVEVDIFVALDSDYDYMDEEERDDHIDGRIEIYIIKVVAKALGVEGVDILGGATVSALDYKETDEGIQDVVDANDMVGTAIDELIKELQARMTIMSRIFPSRVHSQKSHDYMRPELKYDHLPNIDMDKIRIDTDEQEKWSCGKCEEVSPLGEIYCTKCGATRFRKSSPGPGEVDEP
jgi:hypothetical protein